MLPLILATDKGGMPYRWIDYEQAAFYYAKDLVAWDYGDDFRLHGGTNALTQVQSTLDIKSIIAIKGFTIAKLGDKIKDVTLTNKSLFARDQNVCAYCGGEFTYKDLSREHVTPRSKGGPDIWENVVTACKRCNNKKDNKTLADVGMKLLYVPYKPCRSQHLILQNRNILADQMDFLKATIKKTT